MARSKKDKTTDDKKAATPAGDADSVEAVTPAEGEATSADEVDAATVSGDDTVADASATDAEEVPVEAVESDPVVPDDSETSELEEPEVIAPEGEDVAARVSDDSVAGDMDAGDDPFAASDVVTEAGDGPPPDLDSPAIADRENDHDTRHAMPVPVPEPAPSGGGMMSMLLGGVLAAAIGFFAAQFANGGWPFGSGSDGYADLQAGVEARIAEVEATANAAQEAAANAVQPGDLTVFQDGQTATNDGVASLNARLEEIDGRFEALNARLDTLEKRPISEGVSDEAIAAYERELDTLREAIAQQRAEVDRKTEEAAAMEASAAETARMTMAGAAVSRIRGAVEEGAPFNAAILDLREAGVEPPALLADVADEGVVTRAVLQDRFPNAARDALRDWRTATRGSDEGGGVGNIVSGWLGARSVTPRDGDDPDAVLSRAEAAVREGRLADALAEIETLPESARTALDAWERDARRRMDVRGAVDDLAQSLNQG